MTFNRRRINGDARPTYTTRLADAFWEDLDDCDLRSLERAISLTVEQPDGSIEITGRASLNVIGNPASQRLFQFYARNLNRLSRAMFRQAVKKHMEFSVVA